ncbi:MAG: tail fiber domain-containing protein [Bacteroidota bacterium]
MKKLFNSKTNSKLNHKVWAALALMLAGSSVMAQNSSFDNDAIPIGGNQSCAFGRQSLFNNNGTDNTASGFMSLWTNNIGSNNVGFGSNASYNNKNGNDNTAIGTFALYNNVDDDNTAVGSFAAYNNTSANRITAIGKEALFTNTTVSGLTAVGYHSLYSNTTGSENTALGYNSLSANTIGWRNTAIGHLAMNANTSGFENTAVGEWALLSNTSGNDNTAIGSWSLFSNTTGLYNVSVGNAAMGYNTTGYYSAAVGTFAMLNNTTGFYNTAMGISAMFNNTTGYCNSTFGYGSDVSNNNLNNATAIGYGTVVNASDKVRLGNAAVTVIEGQVAFTNPSDGRFKTNVKEEVRGLDFITKLRPVVYNFECKKFEEFLTKDMPDSIKQNHMKVDFGPGTAVRQSGFIAQEVEEAAKAAGYDFNGVHKPTTDNDNYSLAYGQFVVPLVKAVQEQQAQIEELKALVAALSGKEIGKAAVTGTTSNVSLSDKNAIVLNQNVPNPFAESTVITYNVPNTFQKAQIVFTTAEGKVIRTHDITEKGKGQLNIFADDLTSGIYVYTLVVDGKSVETKKMVKQ